MKKVFSISVLVFSIIYISSCSLSGSGTNTPGAALLVSQQSPVLVGLNLTLNSSTLYNGIGYQSTQPYTSLASGGYELEYAEGGYTFLNTTVNLSPGIYYSFITFDSGNTMKSTLVADNQTVPGADSVKIRFFQLSPIDSAVDFAINDSTLSFNRKFDDQDSLASYQNFIYLPAGTHTFSINLTGTKIPIIYPVSKTLVGGKIYTLILTGLTSGAGKPDSLTTSWIQHN